MEPPVSRAKRLGEISVPGPAHHYHHPTRMKTIAAAAPSTPARRRLRLGATAALAAAGILAGPAAGTLRAQVVSTWNGGAGSWDTATLWTPNGIPNAAIADAFIDGGKTGTASVVSLAASRTVGRLTVDAGDTLNLNNGGVLNVQSGSFAGSGSIVNNGSINLATPGASAVVRLFSDVTLDGTGVLTFNGGVNNRLFANTAGLRLTVGASQTIAGAGDLGVSSTNFTNGGTVTANQSGGTLLVNPGAGRDFTNTGAGVARAENGGILNLNQVGGGTATFAGGSFQALAGSQVQLSGGITVQNATFATAGSGLVNVTGGNVTFSNVTNAGALTLANAASVNLSGTLTNNGAVNVNSTGLSTDLRLTGDVTLNGTGTLTFNGGITSRLYANTAGFRLTVGAGQTIAGAGNLGVSNTNFTNGGRVLANQSGATMTISLGVGRDFTNTATGSLQAVNGGTLSFTAGGALNNAGALVASTTTPGNSTLTVPAASLSNLAGGTLTGGAYVANSDGIGNGTATLNFTGAGGAITTNNARVALRGPNSVFANINGLANNQGAFALASGRNFTTLGALTSSGALAASDGSTLTVNGGLTVTPAGRLVGDGAFTAATLAVAGAVSPGGGFDPEAPDFLLGGVGQMTLNGATTFSGATLLAFELGQTGLATSDSLNVLGVFTLDGTLNVTALSGFGAGRYDLIDYSGALTDNGLFLGSLPAGYTYALDTASFPGQVGLVVTAAVPEPATWATTVAGLGLLLVGQQRGRRPARQV